ncbi:MAG: PKD domain-containing protein, partial [Gammaproteobacteria bacterium]|nr:PKD domain-containing protein [Gammaproteobacteria bacterium]
MDIRSKTTVIAILMLGMLVQNQSVFGFSGGISSYSGNPAVNGGNTCTLCHSGGLIPALNLNGPLNLQPGAIGTYTLSLSGGQANTGGLDVSADGGSLISTLSSTKILAGELTHSQRATASGDGSVSWNFDWQAPISPGSYTLFAAGLSSNGDNSTGGDGAVSASQNVDVFSGAPESPTAIIKAPLTVAVNATVSFDGSSSFDPDGTINLYAWDFGDGNIASGAQAINNFIDPGIYTVRLSVTDNDNLTDTTFQDVTVGGLMIPVADPGGPYSGYENQMISFDATGSTHVEPITNYIWDFGDGSPFEQSGITTISHTYAQPGSYIVTLAVQDARFITGVASTTVVIQSIAPPPPPDGAALYGDNCAACHGPLASSTKLNRSAGEIQFGIDTDIGNMGGLSSLLQDEIQAIADALVDLTPPPPPPPVTDGPTLYANNCAACHGPLASSTKLNRSAGQIQNAIDFNTGGMSGLSGLNAIQVQAIADALVDLTPPPPPPPVTDGPTLYANNCAACHGPLASSTKLNRSAGQIQNAMDFNTGGMSGLSGLNAIQVQAIADALVDLTPPPPPVTDGPTLYANNCAACHGPLAS